MAVILATNARLLVAGASELKTFVDACKFGGWTLGSSSAAVETSGLNDTTAVFASGLYDWSASADLMFPTTPVLGNGLLITAGSNYTEHVTGLTLTMTWAEYPYVTASATAPGAVSYAPGELTWSGQYTALMDSATAIDIGSTRAETAGDGGNSATFRIREDGSDDDEFSGNIIVTNVSAQATRGGLQEVTVQFQGSGALTSAGTGNIFAEGAVGIPTATSAVFTSTTGRTFTGDAFAQSLTLNVRPQDAITLSATIRGVGDLTTV